VPGEKRKLIEVNLEELDRIVEEAATRPLTEVEQAKLKNAIHAMAQKLVPARTSEKIKDIFEKLKSNSKKRAEGESSPGHGRNGAAAYTGAETIEVPNADFASGAPCPECPKGRLYPQKPRVLVRITGQAPIQATKYVLQSLRCNLCGESFTAAPPAEVGDDKYDESVASMVAILKYGTGLPFNRLAALEEMMGVPLPTSTQWDLIEDAAEIFKPVHQEMIRQAGEAETIHNDDTSAKILRLERPPDDKRTGVHTTGLVAVKGDRRIPLFFTGRQHAGENLRDILLTRPSELGPPIQMADASSRNAPKLSEGASTTLANCLAHGRRHVAEAADAFPEDCLHILEQLGVAFKNDAEAKRQGLSPKDRLRFHRDESAPVLNRLHSWLKSKVEEQSVEPTSGLGKAIQYLLTHWTKLTLFTRVAGAPIDNNICERALKKAVLHRKNAYFYRSVNGAQVGDIFMSLIHACELNQVNAFAYLTGVQKNALEVKARPAEWLPWVWKARVPAAV
jgi:hypothetical protein